MNFTRTLELYTSLIEVNGENSKLDLAWRQRMDYLEIRINYTQLTINHRQVSREGDKAGNFLSFFFTFSLLTKNNNTSVCKILDTITRKTFTCSTTVLCLTKVIFNLYQYYWTMCTVWSKHNSGHNHMDTKYFITQSVNTILFRISFGSTKYVWSERFSPWIS